MQAPVFDHVALHVADVPASVAFYQDVLGLNPIPRPAFDFPGAWLSLGGSHQLHLIGGRDQPTASHSRGTHFALTIDDVDVWLGHLERHAADMRGPRTRPDGYTQIFVIDPDGHWVELNRPPD